MAEQFDKSIFVKMRRHKDLSRLTDEEIEKGIIRGREILAEDELFLQEKRIIRSHYTMSREDKEAMWMASLYNTILEVNNSPVEDDDDDFWGDDEEE